MMLTLLLAAYVLGATPELNDDNVAQLRDAIRPRQSELAFLKIAWRESFFSAVNEARETTKPILLWAMDINVEDSDECLGDRRDIPYFAPSGRSLFKHSAADGRMCSAHPKDRVGGFYVGLARRPIEPRRFPHLFAPIIGAQPDARHSGQRELPLVAAFDLSRLQQQERLGIRPLHERE